MIDTVRHRIVVLSSLPLFTILPLLLVACSNGSRASGPPPAPSKQLVSQAPELLDEAEVVGDKISDKDHQAYFFHALCEVSVQLRSGHVERVCEKAISDAVVHVQGCQGQKLQAEAKAALLSYLNPTSSTGASDVSPVCGGSVEVRQVRMSGRAEQLSRLAKIREAVQIGDLRTAKKLAGKASDDAFHIRYYCAIVPLLKKSHPIEARQVYGDECSRLQEVKDPEQEWEALVAIAEAAAAVDDQTRFPNYTTDAFYKGVALFEDDHRRRAQLPPDERDTYAGLGRLVEMGVSHHLDWLVERIRDVQDEELKAILLMFAAKGAAAQRSATPARNMH